MEKSSSWENTQYAWNRAAQVLGGLVQDSVTGSKTQITVGAFKRSTWTQSPNNQRQSAAISPKIPSKKFLLSDVLLSCNRLSDYCCSINVSLSILFSRAPLTIPQSKLPKVLISANPALSILSEINNCQMKSSWWPVTALGSCVWNGWATNTLKLPREVHLQKVASFLCWLNPVRN